MEKFLEKYDIIDKIDDNFVIVDYLGINLIYSIKDDKINATKMCNIFGKKLKRLFENNYGKLLKRCFPDKFKSINNVKLELRGTYIDIDLITTIISWENPLIGYYIANQYYIPTKILNSINNIKLKGYIYIVQPERYINTNIIKIGRTYNTKLRFQNYGKNIKIFLIKEVDNMYDSEIKIINNILINYKISKNSREYIDLGNKNIEEFINEINNII